MSEATQSAAERRLNYELPPVPPLRVLVALRAAGLFDPRSLYTSGTVFALAHMTYDSITDRLQRYK